MPRILSIAFCLTIFGLGPLHAQHHPPIDFQNLNPEKTAEPANLFAAVYIPVDGAPLAQDINVFIKNDGGVLLSETFFFPKTRIPQTLPLLRSKPDILAKLLLAAEMYLIEVDVTIAGETVFQFSLDELIDVVPEAPQLLTLKALPSMVTLDSDMERALLLYDFADGTTMSDAEIPAIPPAKRITCGIQCENTYNSCMVAAGGSFFQRIRCLLDFRDCANSCVVIPTSRPTSSIDTFHAVGDGRGDNSSDFYKFRFLSSPLGGSRIANVVKIGETGHIMTDVAVSPAGTFYAVSNTGRLYLLNPVSGGSSYIGRTPYGINSLDFCGNTLYGWSSNSNNLYIINTSNGAGTNLGNRFKKPSGDIACSTSGLLYGITVGSGNSDHLAIPFRFYNRTVSVDDLGTSSSTRNVYGADFDSSGILYAGKGNSDHIRLYYINPATGEATWVGIHFNTYGLNGLTIGTLPL